MRIIQPVNVGTGDHNRFHDNLWCLDPEKTIEVMRHIDVPWIAFKVLAAGAIHPRQGFGYAFRNGADTSAKGSDHEERIVRLLCPADDSLRRGGG